MHLKLRLEPRNRGENEAQALMGVLVSLAASAALWVAIWWAASRISY